MDEDSKMLAYIDKVIVGDRTSDAAEDSAGAAWAAYQRGEFSVPAWFSEEYEIDRRSYKAETSTGSSYNYTPKSGLSLDTFLKSMGILFLAILGFLFLLLIFGFFA